MIERELPVGQAELAFADGGELLDPAQKAALAELVAVLAARAGAAEQLEATGAAGPRVRSL